MWLARSLVLILSCVFGILGHDGCLSGYRYMLRRKTPYQTNLIQPRAMDFKTWVSEVPGRSWYVLINFIPKKPNPNYHKLLGGSEHILTYDLSKDGNSLVRIWTRRAGAMRGYDGGCVDHITNYRRVSKKLAVFRGIDAGQIREDRFFSSRPDLYHWVAFCQDVTTIHKGRCGSQDSFLSLEVRYLPPRGLPWDLIMDDLRCEMQLFPDDPRFEWTYFAGQCPGPKKRPIPFW